MLRSQHYRYMLFAVFFVALGLTWVVFQTRLASWPMALERRSDVPQLADLSLETEDWDPRIVLLDGYERALVPEVNGFSSPLGSANGALTYRAQAFMDLNQARGGRHSGDDLNGIGGMDTDLGDAVYAVADALVIYSGVPSEGWGGVMILAHRLPEGTLVQSFYGHLGARFHAVGDLVGRGEKIAVLGEAKASTAAHLHFEMIRSSALEAGQPGYLAGPGNRLNPSDLLAEYPAVDPERASALSMRDMPEPRYESVESPSQAP